MNERLGLLCVLPLVLTSVGCHHARPATNPWIHGKPPEYRLPADTTTRESVSDFVARVRRLQAHALAGRVRTVMPTIETTDARLGRALALLGVAPSAEKQRLVAAEYLRVGVRDVAMEHFSAALEVDPRDGASYDSRARIWRDWGFPHQGLGDAYRAIYYAPRSAASHNTLGTLFHRLGRYGDARKQYEQALALDGSAAYALNNLCALGLDEGDAAAAVPWCSQALRIEPTLRQAHVNLARGNAIVAEVNDDARH